MANTWNREHLIAYLLHEMPEEDRAAFCEEWIADAQLHEDLRMMEAELLDSYVRGEGSVVQRGRIEEYLLSQEGQAKKVAFARSLQQAVRSRERRPVLWAWMGMAAAILLLAGTSLWLWRENLLLRGKVDELHAVSRVPAGPVFTVTLPLDLLRGTARDKTVELPRDASVLRLDLEMEAGDQSALSTVDVSSATGVVWHQSPVREERRGAAMVASVWIPAAQLPAGRYEIRLSADGKAQAYYRMVVTSR
jgi:hypothetical protein